jgi:hypothetical protein
MKDKITAGICQKEEGDICECDLDTLHKEDGNWACKTCKVDENSESESLIHRAEVTKARDEVEWRF